MIPIAASILTVLFLAADCWLTLSKHHAGYEHEMNPILRHAWKRFGRKGVVIYFAVVAALLLRFYHEFDTDIILVTTGLVIAASVYGIVSILRVKN